ncbi:MAG: chemotaxis protein CheD [Motiliproteus sp.]
MKKVVLSPGEFFFGAGDEEIRTLLGSCIAITLWHPQRRLGGMCHFLLPSAGKPPGRTLDGRYADQAMALFLAALKRTRTAPREFQVKVFGGGNMFPDTLMQSPIGERNIEAAHSLLSGHGFPAPESHVGCSGHRTVILDLATGHTWLRWKKGNNLLL